MPVGDNNMEKMSERIKRRLAPPSASINLSRKKVEELIDKLGPQAKILDLGSGTRRLATYIINLDLKMLSNVDVIANGCMLPFKSESFDAVIITAVLEHVPEPAMIINEILRILKKGGYIYAEAPFIQAYHPAPEDYWRFTSTGINCLFRNFEKLESGVCIGPTSALCGILQEYFPLVIDIPDIPVIRRFIYFIVGWMGFLLKYLDLWLVSKKRAHIACSGFYFYGKKSKEP